MHFAEDKKEEEELTDIISLQAVHLGLFREKRIKAHRKLREKISTQLL